MEKIMEIIEKASGRLIADYPIDLDDPRVTEEDFCVAAWDKAVVGGLVKPDDSKENYVIKPVDEMSTP